MHIAMIRVRISLPGCASLKEKRRRVGGLHERLGRSPAVALCESGALDSWQASEWSLVVVDNYRKNLEARCGEIEAKLEQHIDGRIVDVEREFF